MPHLKSGGNGDHSYLSVHQRLQRLGSTRGIETFIKNEMRKERNASVSRNGTGQMGTRSTKHSVSVRKVIRGATDVKQIIEDVYAEMEHERIRGVLKIPLKFADFYNDEMMMTFIKACMQHADTFVSVRQLERAMLRAQTISSERPLSQTENAEQSLSYHKAVAAHAESAIALGKCYSKLVLHCSNFERHDEDRTFFEAVYYFVCAIVKICHPSEQWQPIEEELGYAFRGEVFNVNGKTHLHPSPPSPAPSPPKVNASRFGQSVSATDSDVDSKFQISGMNSAYGSYGQSVAISAIINRVDTTKSRVEHNIQVSQSIRNRINHQRNQNKQVRDQLEREFNQRNERRAVARLEHLLDIPLKPLSPQNPCAPTTKSPRQSMRRTLGARSPLISFIFPTAQDQVELAQRMMEEQQPTESDTKRTPPQSPQTPNPMLPRFKDLFSFT